MSSVSLQFPSALIITRRLQANYQINPLISEETRALIGNEFADQTFFSIEDLAMRVSELCLTDNTSIELARIDLTILTEALARICTQNS